MLHGYCVRFTEVWDTLETPNLSVWVHMMMFQAISELGIDRLGFPGHPLTLGTDGTIWASLSFVPHLESLFQSFYLAQR